MGAAHHQSQQRRLEVRAREHRGVDVPPEVIDPADGPGPRGSESLRNAHPDQEAAREAGASRNRDQVDVVPVLAGRLECQFEQLRQPLQVVAGRELRDDAAEILVQVDLRVDDVGQDAAAIFNQCDRGFVARRFDSEDEAAFYCCSPFVIRSRRSPRTSESILSRLASYARRNRGEWMESDHITIASSPLSV